jgi:hypothetical protein
MIQHIPDNEIRQEYITYASFYDVQFNNQMTWRFRRLLQIIKTDFDQYEGEEHLAEEVEVTFVLMNPGSAEPLNQAKVPKVEIGSILPFDPEVRLTQPDKAQYQIMRLMKLKNWKRVQIINLSDIKSAGSKKFYSKFKYYENSYDESHSIFSSKRIPELTHTLNLSSKGPIIVAWGTSSDLIRLAGKAINNLPKDRIVGIHNNLYYHASPQKMDDKIRWLISINQILL